MAWQQLNSEIVDAPADSLALYEEYYNRGWTDGLPVIPPTEDAVRQALAYTDRDSNEVVGMVPVRNAPATVEKVAVNAVMAGCKPEYLPVVLTALEAAMEERFGLYSVQATTHGCGPLIIVNGPIARELEINGAFNAFGPCNRANATIGRAIRLILLNIGGGKPGYGDMSTQGGPSKYTYCVAENEDENPWEPLHVELGYPSDVSTVTVVSGESPHNYNNSWSITAGGILRTLARTVANPGANTYLFCDGSLLIALGPEHAATIADDGYSKQDVRDYIWEHATLSEKDFDDVQISKLRELQPKRLLQSGAHQRLRVAPTKEDIDIIVLGGPGKHSSVIHTFALGSYRVTRAISRNDGTPAKSIGEFAR